MDTSLALLPVDVVLPGRFGRLERTEAGRHGADLWDAVRDRPDVWDYLTVGPFDRASFADYLRQCEANRERIFYSVVDTSGRATGLLALIGIRPAHRVIEVGNIIYGAPLQRTALGTEAHYLLARYVFEKLNYRRYVWRCDAANTASRRAAARLGFSYEGRFRQHMIVKGRSRDTDWFSLLDSEWPARKAAFERWLEPSNFDAEGRQHTRLGRASNGGSHVFPTVLADP